MLQLPGCDIRKLERDSAIRGVFSCTDVKGKRLEKEEENRSFLKSGYGEK